MVTMQIWTNRLLKELDGVDSRLPVGVSLSSHDMEPEAGVCKAYFEASLAAPSKSKGTDGGGGGDDGDDDEGGRAEKEEVAKKEEEEEEDGGGGGGGGGDGKSSSPPPSPPPGPEEGGGEGEGKDDGERPPLPSKGGDGGSGEGEGVGGGTAGGTPPQPSPPPPPPSLLQFKIEMDLGLDTRYPFESPVIRVLEGDDVIPTSILSGDDLLNLPGSDAWTPSSTIVHTLQDIVDMVLHANEVGLPTGHGGDDAGALERGDLRPGAVVGTEALLLFPCVPPATPLFSGSVLAPRSRRPLDRYIGVTDRQLLELEAHRTRMGKTVVVLAIPLSTLKKLKFRRGASVTVILKNGEAKEFLTPQSFECVTAVTERLQKMGIAGHQTTTGAERQVDLASSLMAALARKEEAFGVRETPDLSLVEECMDLFRQAAELYSAAGDPRHEEVLAHMHRFLQREDVLGALVGGSPSGDATAAHNDNAPAGPPPVPGGGEGSGGAAPLPAAESADGSRAAPSSAGEGAESAGAGLEAEEDTAAVAATPPPTSTTKGAGSGSGSGNRKAPSTTGGSGRGRSSPSGKAPGGASGRGSESRASPASKKDAAAAAAAAATGADPSKGSPRADGGAVGRGRGKPRGGGGRGGRGSSGARGRGGGGGAATPTSGTTGSS